MAANWLPEQPSPRSSFRRSSTSIKHFKAKCPQASWLAENNFKHTQPTQSMQTVPRRLLHCSIFLRYPKDNSVTNLIGAINDDSYSNVCQALSIGKRTVHADSCSRTLPLLYSSLYITKIIQSLNLTDAITDDSYSNVHLFSSIDTIHADSSIKTPPLLCLNDVDR
jgi:hypothetical protein